MKITLCGSARFEPQFKEWNRRLSLAGHLVYSLSCYPSDHGGKDWYTAEQKIMLDLVHKDKIANSDAIVVINENGYIGDSTRSEIEHARALGKKIYYVHFNGFADYPPNGEHRCCPYKGCADPVSMFPPCALCYE